MDNSEYLENRKNVYKSLGVEILKYLGSKLCIKDYSIITKEELIKKLIKYDIFQKLGKKIDKIIDRYEQGADISLYKHFVVKGDLILCKIVKNQLLMLDVDDVDDIKNTRYTYSYKESYNFIVSNITKNFIKNLSTIPTTKKENKK